VGVEQGHPLLLVPDVVAGGPHVHRADLELGEDLGGDAEAAGRVLDVGDHEVDPLAVDELLEVVGHRLAAGRPHDVADEQQSGHLAYSTARVSRITVTLICPG
jgi:hypothetical protein